jgi:hypothetical protein
MSGVGTGVKYVDVARDVINAATMEFITYLVRLFLQISVEWVSCAKQTGLRLNADYVDLAE